jgi:hypothetical protein
MLSDLPRVSESISAAVISRQAPPPFMGETTFLQVLNRSTAVNVGAFLSTLAFGVPADSVDPPDGAIELVDFIASDPDGLPLLLRIYRLGAAATWQLFVEFLVARVQDREILANLILLAGEHLNTYADHVVECLSIQWTERTHRVQRDGRRQEAALRALLTGDEQSAGDLEYPLARHHIAMAIGKSALGADRIAREMIHTVRRLSPGAGTIELPGYKGFHLLWISTDSAPPQHFPETLLGTVGLGSHVAVSDVAFGTAGFALVAREACETVATLVRIDATGGRATYRQLALVVTLLADPSRALRFATVILGPLATQSADAERMRGTLVAYFRCGASKVGAGAILHVHEKTVATRLRRITQLIGAPIDTQRPELEAALAVFAALR